MSDLIKVIVVVGIGIFLFGLFNGVMDRAEDFHGDASQTVERVNDGIGKVEVIVDRFMPREGESETPEPTPDSTPDEGVSVDVDLVGGKVDVQVNRPEEAAPRKSTKYLVMETAPWCGPCQKFKKEALPETLKNGWRVEYKQHDGGTIPEFTVRDSATGKGVKWVGYQDRDSFVRNFQLAIDKLDGKVEVSAGRRVQTPAKRVQVRTNGRPDLGRGFRSLFNRR